jgi:hypothetical protein
MTESRLEYMICAVLGRRQSLAIVSLTRKLYDQAAGRP